MRFGLPQWLDGKESACNAGSIPGLRRPPGEGNGNPLQYSCLETLMDKSLADYNPWGSLVAQLVRNPPAMWETWV